MEVIAGKHIDNPGFVNVGYDGVQLLLIILYDGFIVVDNGDNGSYCNDICSMMFQSCVVDYPWKKRSLQCVIVADRYFVMAHGTTEKGNYYII